MTNNTPEKIALVLVVPVEDAVGNLIAAFPDLRSAASFIQECGLNGYGDPVYFIPADLDPTSVPYSLHGFTPEGDVAAARDAAGLAPRDSFSYGR